MRAYRLSRSLYPAYDGEGAKRVGGRWNSTGTRVFYMSENRALCVLEILVHLTDTLPDQYLLGVAQIPEEIAFEEIRESSLPSSWKTPLGIINLRGSIAGGTKVRGGKSESRLTESSRTGYFVPEMEAFVAKSSILFGLE
jgi:RES domain-containing protein